MIKWLKTLWLTVKADLTLLEVPTGRRPFGLPYDPQKEQLDRIEQKLDKILNDNN